MSTLHRVDCKDKEVNIIWTMGDQRISRMGLLQRIKNCPFVQYGGKMAKTRCGSKSMGDSGVFTENRSNIVDPLAQRMEHRRLKWLVCLELLSEKKYTVLIICPHRNEAKLDHVMTRGPKIQMEYVRNNNRNLFILRINTLCRWRPVVTRKMD